MFVLSIATFTFTFTFTFTVVKLRTNKSVDENLSRVLGEIFADL